MRQPRAGDDVGTQELGGGEEPRTDVSGNWPKPPRRRLVAHYERCAGIANDILNLGGRMRDSQGNSDTTSAPDSPQHCGVRKAWRHEERNARLLQIPSSREQHFGNTPRFLVEVAMCENSVGGNDGDAR